MKRPPTEAAYFGSVVFCVTGPVTSVLHMGHRWVRVSRAPSNVSAMVSHMIVVHFGQAGPSRWGASHLIDCCMYALP
jgi:hypothetical protein